MSNIQKQVKNDSKKVARDVVLVFGAIMTSNGLTAFLPSVDAVYLVIGGILITYGATRMK